MLFLPGSSLVPPEAAQGISLARQGGVWLFQGGKLKPGDGGRRMMHVWGKMGNGEHPPARAAPTVSSVSLASLMLAQAASQLIETLGKSCFSCAQSQLCSF